MPADVFTWFDKDGNLITGPACEQPVGKRRFDPKVHAVMKPTGIALHQAYTDCGSSVFEILDGATVDCETCIAVLEQPETDRMVAFLTARLDEEHEAATDATAGPWFAEDQNAVWGDDKDSQLIGGGKILATLRSEYRGYLNGVHIALWDPARGLADIAAKRELLARFSKMDNTRYGYLEMRFAVRLAASVYNTRDGYQAAWAPVWHREDWS